MPFAGFDDWDDCIQTMTEEEGHDQDSAENICGALEAEAKSENGDPDSLLDALQRGGGLIADVGVDLVSGVDVPAIDSKWVMLKSEKSDFVDEILALADDDVDRNDIEKMFDGEDLPNKRVHSPHLLDKDADTEKRISYAAAMIPREPDKEGDVVPTATVESAAHDFLKSDGGIDTDHSLIDGDGDPVESWVLKQERSFDLPDGGEESYPAGTWMLGVEWDADAWKRIKEGELTGLSIYGMAEHVPLERAATCACGDPIEATAKQLDIPLAGESVVHLVYESRTAAEKASEEIGLDGDVHEHEFDGMTVFMPGENHEAFVDTYMDLSEDETDAELSAAKSETPDTDKREDAKSDTMGQEQTDSTDADGDGPTVKDLADRVDSLAESIETIEESMPEQSAGGDISDLIREFTDKIAEHDDIDKNPDAIKSDLREALKGTDEAAKQSIDDAVAMVADEYDLSPDNVFDIMDAAGDADADEVLEAIESVVASASDKAEDEDEDEEEEEMEQSAAKRADDANLSKGSDSRQTAAKGIEDDGGASSGLPSYKAAAEEHGD